MWRLEERFTLVENREKTNLGQIYLRNQTAISSNPIMLSYLATGDIVTKVNQLEGTKFG